MKERVTLTIETDILSRVDARIDGHTIKNRSHAVELMLMHSLGTEVPKKAVILAAGKGKLKPINEELPMSLLPIHNKPVLEHVIDLLRNQGITDLVIGVAYKKEKIKDYFGNGQRFGVKITYVEENEPSGTAQVLRQAKSLLEGSFVVTNGDDLKNVDIADMFAFHKKNKALATLALTTTKDPAPYGVVRLKGDRILEFIEKPKESANRLINGGLYILEPEALEKLETNNDSLTKHLLPALAKAQCLFGYSFDGQWFDTGTLEGYEDALRSWKDL
jgi:mannose-1-phosphate guanylyltransferase / phosphomannomutase